LLIRWANIRECPCFRSSTGISSAVLIASAPPSTSSGFTIRAPALFERRVDGDGEVSDLRRLGAGDRNAVRDYDETRHHTPSHLTDRRIAELMIPAIE
jgi:hypothetical protein